MDELTTTEGQQRLAALPRSRAGMLRRMPSNRPIGNEEERVSTPDLLAAILTDDPGELEKARERVRASAGRGDRSLVADAERAVRRAPRAAITFDANGSATVVAGDREYCGGRFAPRSVGELTTSIASRGGPSAPPPTFSVVEGSDPVTDIGALQAMAAPGTLFQVASQFNCLEAPGPDLVPVADYLHDPTQGPRASVSAFPGTLVRHYAVPDGPGRTFTQTPERQIDLLADALRPGVGRVRFGYLQTANIRNLEAAAVALEEHFDRIRVGVHDDVEVVLGVNWDGAVEGRPRIAQVFTSSLATGMYGHGESVTGPVEAICRHLLRAAHLGTMLAALDVGRTRVVLTMIGGGVFGNPHHLILEAALWATDQVAALGAGPLDVVLNSRNLNPAVDREWVSDECQRRGGVHRPI